MHLAVVAGILVPGLVGAQVIPGLLQDGAPEAVASWPMWGHDAGRSFRVSVPGTTTNGLAYQPWTLTGANNSSLGSVFVGALTGDLDGDGTEEIVVASMPFGFGLTSGRLHVWSATGELWWSKNLTNPSGYPVLMDWNGDATLEVAVANGPRQEVYGPHGELLWVMPQVKPLPCGVQCSESLAADLNEDGIPDIVSDGQDLASGHAGQYAVDGKTGRLLWEYPPPCGTLLDGAAMVHTDSGPRVLTRCRGHNQETRGGATLIALDIRPEPDQLPDSPLMSIRVGWKQDLSRGTKSLDIVGLAAGNVSGDGVDEIVVVTERPHEMHVLSPAGAILATWTDGPDGLPYGVQLAELDGHPGLEFIVNTRDGEVIAYDFADGKVVRMWSALLPGSPTGTIQADLDGDGRDEIVVPLQLGDWCQPSASGQLVILDHLGLVGWEGGRTPGCVQPVRGMAAADLDKDGDVELVVPAVTQVLVYGIGPQPALQADRGGRIS